MGAHPPPNERNRSRVGISTLQKLPLKLTCYLEHSDFCEFDRESLSLNSSTAAL